MTQRTPDLLPCPFCGGPAKTTRWGDKHTVYCINDDDCRAVFTVYGETLAEVAAAWNTRAPVPVNAALLEALQAAIPALDMLATKEGRQNREPHAGPDRTAARDRAHNARAAVAKTTSHEGG